MLLVAVVVAWYLVTAVVLGVFFNWGLGGLLWVFQLKAKDFVLMYLLSSLGMLFAGYLVRYWELYSRERELDDREDQLRHWEDALRKGFAEFKRLAAEKKKYEEAVRTLADKKVALREEVEDLYSKKEVLESELEYLREEAEDLDRKVRKAEERGYQDGYNRVLDELHSLRAQKSAVLDLFEEVPELEEILLRRKGMNLRRFLEVEKKRRLKHAGDGKSVEDVSG